jgi:hypothetical protein
MQQELLNTIDSTSHRPKRGPFPSTTTKQQNKTTIPATKNEVVANRQKIEAAELEEGVEA